MTSTEITNGCLLTSRNFIDYSIKSVDTAFTENKNVEKIWNDERVAEEK